MNPYCYRGFGLLIHSELKLPELATASPGDREKDGQADLVIRRGTVLQVPRKITLDEELAINGLGAAFLIRHGREITVDARRDADPALVRVLLLGRVMAFLLRQRGWLPLHASGVVIDNECVLFLGAPGAGKSTTAAAFYKRGRLVATDDVGAVRVASDGRCVMQSAWSYLRLCEDARVLLDGSDNAAGFQADKHRYDLNRAIVPGDLYPVRCAYIVEYGDDLQAEPVETLRAVTLLSRHSFVKHRNMERNALQGHLRDCSAVSSVIPVRRLIRPRSLAALPAVVRFVEEDLAGLKGSAQGHVPIRRVAG
jgi:hypothetical protein